MVAYDINLIHMKERVFAAIRKLWNDAGKKRLANVSLPETGLLLRKSADRLLPKTIEGGADAFLIWNQYDINSLFVYNKRFGTRGYQ